MTIDAEAVAAGLTEAQREAFAKDRACVFGLDDFARDKPGVASQLHKLGLTYVQWSPLGYAVRAHLNGAA